MALLDVWDYLCIDDINIGSICIESIGMEYSIHTNDNMDEVWKGSGNLCWFCWLKCILEFLWLEYQIGT